MKQNIIVVLIVVCLLIGVVGSYGGGYIIYQPQIRNYEDQVSSLTSEVSRLNSTVSSKQAQISILQTELSDTQNAISNYETELSSLRSQVSNYKTELSSLRSQVSTLKSQVAASQAQISTLQAQISTLQTENRMLRNQIENLLQAPAPLADQINASLSEVTNWEDLVNIGVVMNKSQLGDFDTWITSRADASDWKGVFAVKRYAEQAGYSSKVIDAKVKLALSNIPMFKNYSLPITDTKDSGYFWPWDRYVLYGYRYAEELNWETGRWNKTSGFLALKSVRDWYGRAFYRCNPDIPTAEELFGTRWHQAGSLMDSFFIFYKLDVKDALPYAVHEWEWLNNQLWSNSHFNYASSWPNWEFSGISVFPNVAKLQRNGISLGNWSRVTTDLQLRYISSLWSSPQWHEKYKVAEHHHNGNPERSLDGTLDAWIMLNTFYSLFDSGNRTNMKNMLEGNGVTQAWIGLNESDLRQNSTNRFSGRSYSIPYYYSDSATALAALCLFLLGISPQEGRGLAIPLISDRHSCYASLNYRYFEFDYTNHKIKIPVWGGTTLKFIYGNAAVNEYFETNGIYDITFTSDWNSISQVTKVSNLYSDEYYLWTQESLFL